MNDSHLKTHQSLTKLKLQDISACRQNLLTMSVDVSWFGPLGEVSGAGMFDPALASFATM